MAWTDLTPEEQTLEWATALAAALKERVEVDGGWVRTHPATAADLQRILEVSQADPAVPRIDIVVESTLAVLQVDSGKTADVLYEFEGTPDELRSRLSASEETDATRGKSLLDEVALVHHALASMTLGYSYVRFPLFERLRIPALGGTAALDWGSYDLNWPPITVRRFNPA